MAESPVILMHLFVLALNSQTPTHCVSYPLQPTNRAANNYYVRVRLMCLGVPLAFVCQPPTYKNRRHPLHDSMNLYPERKQATTSPQQYRHKAVSCSNYLGSPLWSSPHERSPTAQCNLDNVQRKCASTTTLHVLLPPCQHALPPS